MYVCMHVYVCVCIYLYIHITHKSYSELGASAIWAFGSRVLSLNGACVDFYEDPSILPLRMALED